MGKVEGSMAVKIYGLTALVDVWKGLRIDGSTGRWVEGCQVEMLKGRRVDGLMG